MEGKDGAVSIMWLKRESERTELVTSCCEENFALQMDNRQSILTRRLLRF